jgi:hypothetical protein
LRKAAVRNHPIKDRYIHVCKNNACCMTTKMLSILAMDSLTIYNLNFGELYFMGICL